MELFDTARTSVSTRQASGNLSARRVLAGGILAVTGVAVAVPNAQRLGTGDGLALAATALGLVLGLAIVAAGILLYRSTISTPHALRVAGWNTLGVVVLGAVLLLTTQYPGVSLPAPTAASILGVSSVAHIIIGVNDVRRIRAGELAREREKLAVLNRLARHNLRNQAQVLTSAGELVADDAGRQAAQRVQASADRIATINAKLKRFQQATERTGPRRTLDVAAIVAAAVEPYPDEAVTVDVPDDLTVMATDDLEVALDELLENAFEHGKADRHGVRVTATAEGDRVALTVADDGPGIPDHEWDVVTGETVPTQLEHASGLGLWVVKAVVEGADGDLERSQDDTAITIRVPRA